MKKMFTLLLLATATACSAQINSFSNPSGFVMNTSAARLVHDGYLVAGNMVAGTDTLPYITRYQDNGTVSWTKTENSNNLTGIADMVEDELHHLYFLAPYKLNDHYYHLMKTDSAGNLLTSIKLSKPDFITVAAPRLFVNTTNEVFVVTGTASITSVFKIDVLGDMVWSKNIIMDTTVNAPVFAACPTNDGGIILAGQAGSDLFLQRLDAYGDGVWTKRMFDAGNADAQPGCMLALQNGNFLVAGSRVENVGAMRTGMFVARFDDNGIVLDHKFYFDSMAENDFAPYTMAESASGNIHISGQGNEVTYVDLDATLAFVRYTVWNGAEVENMARCFDSSPTWFLTTATSNDTLQYVLHNSLDGTDICSEEEIYSIVQEDLAIDNPSYDTIVFKMSKGTETVMTVDDLQSAANFAQNNVCSLDGTSGNNSEGGHDMEAVAVTFSPNPIEQHHELSVSVNIESAYVTFTNVEGKVIKQQSMNGRSQKITMSDMPTGIYFMNVYVNEVSKKTSKVIVY